MRKALLFLAAGLAAGFALSAWLAPGHRARGADEPRGVAGLTQRVAALEQTLRGEAAERAALASEVAELQARIDGADSSQEPAAGLSRPAPAAELPRADPAATAADDTQAQAPRARFRGRPGPGEGGDSRVERLIAAGFSAERAAYLDRRASELRMQALEAQYEAARSGRPSGPRTSTEQSLREELGDADYERYLSALGRPTRIGVRTVLASSPAEEAGLLPGDEITSYAGQRVFDVGDLNRLTYDGRPGETVAVDIVRNGQPMQVYVPRGPIGIEGGGRFRGGP